MPLNDNALTSIDVMKRHLDIPTAKTDEDDRLEVFINAASQYIESYCMRGLVAKDYTELQSGRRANFLITNQYPINSISSIHIDNTRLFGTDSLVDPLQYTLIDENESIALDFIVQSGLNNVKIVYNAGYQIIPYDLQYACILLSEWYYKLRQRGDLGRSSKSKMGENTNAPNEIPKVVLSLIEKYKRTVIPNSPIPIRNY